MALVVVLTRARRDTARNGRPPSARFTAEREHPLGEALIERGHEVVMWWDEPPGECIVQEPEVAFLRAGGERNLARAEVLRARGTRVINEPGAHRAGADKLLAAELLGAAGVPTPLTVRDPSELNVQVLVAKPRHGSGGSGVLRQPAAEASPVDGTIFQPFLEATDHLRFTVVAGEVVAGERRHLAPQEFRANLAAGASTEGIDPGAEPEAARVAVSATRALGLDLAGVDVVATATGPVVLEVNPATTLWHPDEGARLRVAAALADLA